MQPTPVSTGPQAVPRRTTVSVDGPNVHHDLPRAIEIVRKEEGKPIGIIDPQPRTPVLELHQAGSFTRMIRQADIQAAIFPEVVPLPTGPLA